MSQKKDQSTLDNRSRQLNRQDSQYWKDRGLGERAAANEAARQAQRDQDKRD